MDDERIQEILNGHEERILALERQVASQKHKIAYLQQLTKKLRLEASNAR